MQQKIHTGCSCKRCKTGKNKIVRKMFHKLIRRTHKSELKKNGEIITVDKSIGYTD